MLSYVKKGEKTARGIPDNAPEHKLFTVFFFIKNQQQQNE
jgi:hypothetical protein